MIDFCLHMLLTFAANAAASIFIAIIFYQNICFV